MYKNKSADGNNNLCGKNLKNLRKQASPKMSQRAFADKLQLLGIDLDKNAIQRIECGKRFVTDIELNAFAQILNVNMETLIKNSD